MFQEKKIHYGAEFTDRLEKALAASGMTQTQFGYTHFGDPGALARLRENRRLYQPTVQKIQNVLAMFEK